MAFAWVGISSDKSDRVLNDTTKILTEIQNKFTFIEKQKIFGYCTISDMIAEIGLKEIINIYDKWKEDQKNEFHVGEEVKGKESGNLSWIICVGDNTIVTIFNNGHIFTYDKNEITKTGRFNKTLADIINGGIEKNCLIKDIKYIEEDFR